MSRVVEDPAISRVEKGVDYPTTAVVLAGGLGTRLQTKLSGQPKALANVAGKPFLDYLLGYLATKNIQQVILSLGYLGEQVQNYVGDGHRWGLEVVYIIEPQPLGTGGALRLASQSLQTSFFALNGDTLFLVNLADLALYHRLHHSKVTIALRQIPGDDRDAQQRGCVQLEDSGRIRSFQEKPLPNSPASSETGKSNIAWTNAGVYVVEPGALAWLEPNTKISLEQEVFPHLVKAEQLAGCPMEGYFIDIGTPESLSRFEGDIRKRKFVLPLKRSG